MTERGKACGEKEKTRTDPGLSFLWYVDYLTDLPFEQDEQPFTDVVEPFFVTLSLQFSMQSFARFLPLAVFVVLVFM